MNPGQAAGELAGLLAATGDPARAAGEAAYLKSDLHFFGVRVPDVRRAVKAALRTGRPTHDEAFALADGLWAWQVDGRAVHECRLAAIEVLMASPKLVTAADLPWIEAHLRECGTWALVDPLAGAVAAALAVREPVATLPVLDRWVSDPDFWVRRSAVLAIRGPLAAGRGHTRFYGYAAALLPEREFFIRKVLGWALREEAARRPDDVLAWLRAHMAQMNLVTLREPLRKFPPAMAADLRRAYDTRRNSAG